jgi:hypothetical protein
LIFSALLVALTLHATALGSATLLVLLGLLRGGDATCRKERKRGDAGQQCLLFSPHQALSFPVGCLRTPPALMVPFPAAMLLANAYSSARFLWNSLV